MSSLLAFVAILAAVALTGAPSADARMPADAVAESMPPSTCHSRSCLRGTRAFSRGQYAEAASALESGLWSSQAHEVDLGTYTDMLLLAAVSRRRAGAPHRAATHFQQLARLEETAAPFYAYQALQSALTADDPSGKLLRQLEQRGALSTPYPGHHLARLKYRTGVDGRLESADLAAEALGNSNTEATCQWLASRPMTEWPAADKQRRTLQSATYAHCLDTPDQADPEAFYADEPTPEARLTRAQHWYDRVEYEKTLAELDKLSLDNLDPPDRCRARFRRGRALYRLERYGQAADVYRRVVDECEADASTDPHIRSLYALGRRQYHLGHYDMSRTRFEQILESYPDRSHADDALMFLGRIARARNETARDRELLTRTLEEYPGGDMTHEFVWEHLEPTYRNGDYGAFLDRLDALQLPERDDEYFSQGRLGYFRGRAQMELGDTAAALDAWKRVWEQYPFSFYGYLSHAALDRADVDPPNLATDAARRPPDWFYQPDWQGRPARRLASVGLHGLAADYESGRLAERRERGESVSDADRWRLAYLYHRAGRHTESHNVPRRLIAGRPWTSPETGRLLRWQVAFPTPYLDTVGATVRQYRDREADVPVELPLSIIREESGFVADIESWAGAIGLMQLMPTTAKGHADSVDENVNEKTLRRAEVNVGLGVDHLYYLAERFDSHPAVMAAAYNAGGGAVSSWLPDSGREPIALWVEDIPYRQARHYTKRVMGTFAAYQWLSGTRDLAPAPTEPPPTD
jgi:soluble lytic murein transglycosylase